LRTQLNRRKGVRVSTKPCGAFSVLFQVRETRLMRRGANPSRSENADVPGGYSNRCPVDRPMPLRLKCITSQVIVFGIVCQSRQSTQEPRVLLKKCRWELDKVRVPGGGMGSSPPATRSVNSTGGGHASNGNNSIEKSGWRPLPVNPSRQRGSQNPAL
jgi:hypothetical protein